MQKVRRIALTGGIATGKSHVLNVFERAGIPTLDTDAVARDVVQRGSDALPLITQRFGVSFLDADGALKRRALADLIFADRQARCDLEGIVLPRIREKTNQWLGSLDPAIHRFAVVAIPLLYETGGERNFDVVIATHCAPDAQLHRLMTRNSLTEEAARRWIAAQLPSAEKAARADYVVSTDGSVEQTDEQVQALIQKLDAGS